MTRRVKIARTTRKLRRLKRARASPPPGGLRPTENDKARAAGIPKPFKQYQARYGKGGVDAIVAGHLQNPTPMLDHGRERGEQLRAAVVAMQAIERDAFAAHFEREEG